MQQNNYTSKDFLRIEDANSPNSILKISTSTGFDVDIFSSILSKSIISNSKILVRLDGSFLEDSDYGNLISNFDILRIYTQISNQAWVDLKITDAYYDILFPGETIVEGIILSGSYSSIQINDNVSWGFVKQKNPLVKQKLKLKITAVTENSCTLSWENLLSTTNNIVYQIKYRKKGTDLWSYSEIGNWIFNFTVLNEATNLPKPTRTFMGKNVLWAETSNPQIPKGRNAHAWIEINNGNFGEIFFLRYGSGYQKEPSINFYHANPEDSKIINPHFRKPFYSNNVIIIEKNNHSFIENDILDFDCKMLKGKFKIFDVTQNTFSISSASFDILLDDNLLKQDEGIVKLAKINDITLPGRIKAIISRDKYYIFNLIPKSTYVCAIIPYFSKNLKEFGEYTTESIFTTL